MGIHYAGIVRALASALDCLAGAITGVAGLPTSILKADFSKARRGLSKISGAPNDGAKMQAHFAYSLPPDMSLTIAPKTLCGSSCPREIFNLPRRSWGTSR
jgi:hypothetical protein